MSILDLWMAIVVSGVAVFFASFAAWALSPLHKKDWKRAPNEEALREAIRGVGLEPGVYLFPFATHNGEQNTPEFKEKFMKGPRGILNLWPMPSMGRNMAMSVVVYLCVSAMIAYLASVTLLRGADFGRVMQVTGTAGVLAYSFAFIPNAIWFNTGLRGTVTSVLDGIVYGLVTGAVFGWLWPR